MEKLVGVGTIVLGLILLPFFTPLLAIGLKIAIPACVVSLAGKILSNSRR